MKISNLAPVISIAREPENKDKNLTLHRGFDKSGTVRYIITSTLNGPEIETLGFYRQRHRMSDSQSQIG